MKLINSNYYVVFALLLIGANTTAQESSKGYKENIEMNFGNMGEIAVTSNIKYNASTWDYVKQQHGTDPSVLKNNIKRQFPKYEATDFDIVSNDMDRTSTIKFKLLGSLKVNESGKWVAELDSKNPDITQISGTQFLMVDEENSQTSKINLPKSASDAKIEKDNFGKAILTYKAPVSGGGSGNIIKYLGIIVILAGGFLLYKNRTVKLQGNNHSSYPKKDNQQPRFINDAVTITNAETTSLKSGASSNN